MEIKDGGKLAIGLMSGTSMDGVDAALVKTDGHRVRPVGQPLFLPYSPSLREKIRAGLLVASKLPTKENLPDRLLALEQEITEIHSIAVRALLSENNLSKEDISVIGFHGQTVVHRPVKGWTLQLGCGESLAKKTGIPVVNDFRSNDMRHKGEGAPLAPLYHAALLKDKNIEGPVAILNLGGVGNVSWVKWDGDDLSILAFDTGPGNALMDDWVQLHKGIAYDKDGQLAAVGTTHSNLLMNLMASPYFDENPPKSLDRDDFSIASIRGLSAEDGACTLLDFTIESVIAAQSHFPQPVTAWYVTGGGVHNKTLMRRLRARTPVLVDPVGALGWRADALEAEAFAYLAVRSLMNLPLSLPETTGCIHPVSGGCLHNPFA